MKARKIVSGIVVGALACSMLGCMGSKNKAASRTHDIESTSSMEPAATGFYGEDVVSDSPTGSISKRVMYFDFDRSELSTDDLEDLQAHAKNMLANKSLNLRISGHTDARGSREYNIGLGERRALTVGRYLETLGVPSNRLIVISYGKEQPVALGDTESSWSQNRRAELDYETN